MTRKLALAVIAIVALAIPRFSAGGETLTIGFGHGQPLVSVAHAAMTKMAEEVAEKSGGGIQIQIFPANQLGNERDLAEGLGQDFVDMAWISTAVMENFDSKLSMFSLPYVFKSYDHVAKVVQSDIGDYVFGSLLESQNIRVLGFFDQGFRWVWNNTKPINTLDDVKGMKLRAPESPVYMGTFKLLGSNPTPIPWGELYTALQTKVVEGFEVNPESFIANKMFEVSKYGSKTNHIYAGAVVMIRENLFQELTDEERDILVTAAKNAEKYNRARIIENEAEYVKQALGNGTIINDITDAELKRFSDAVEPLYADYAKRLGSDDIIARAKAMD